MFYRLYFKRIFDLTLTIIALIVLSPIILLTIVSLFIANKNSGVFYTQVRPGKDEKLFSIIKFKSMNDATDKNGSLLPEQDRLTPIGAFIRKTSIDEIPQLINVLKGEMSIVGPRPLFTEYLPYYTDFEKRRHSIRPGITGWAQVNGRNNLNWEKRLFLDVFYVKRHSFLLDLKIILKSIHVVLRRKGNVVISGVHTISLNIERGDVVGN